MSIYLNNIIELYLNDISDFDDESTLIAESVLTPIKQLLDEGKQQNYKEILLEAYNKANDEEKIILKDFFTYIKEGEL